MISNKILKLFLFFISILQFISISSAQIAPDPVLISTTARSATYRWSLTGTTFIGFSYRAVVVRSDLPGTAQNPNTLLNIPSSSTVATFSGVTTATTEIVLQSNYIFFLKFLSFLNNY